MNRIMIKAMLPLAITLALAACSSSDSNTSNADGFVSAGTITGFGSIFVNGVEFETHSASFDVDGVAGSEADLAVGMKVGVSGTINADGVTGTATSVEFDEELQGPVSGISVGDGQTRSFSVIATTVIIDVDDTRFDDDSGNFGFDTIEDNDNVEISGFFDDAGILHATRIELEDADFDAASLVEVEGIISALSGTSFKLGSLNVDASAAQLDDMSNGLIEGAEVEVKGTYDMATNTLHAIKVEGEDNSLHDSDNEVEIEGIVTNYVSDSDFEVDGHKVDASSASREPSSLLIAAGVHIEVEGIVSNGVMIASEAKLRAAENEVAALVKAIGADGSSFSLEPLVGGPLVTVRISSTTELEDEVLELEPFSFAHIQTGDFIKVEGHINNADELEAKSAHRKDASNEDVTMEGVISAFDSVSATTTVTVLGVDFPYLEGSTKFVINEAEVTSAVFFAEPGVMNSTASIEVVDKNPADGTADKIELED